MILGSRAKQLIFGTKLFQDIHDTSSLEDHMIKQFSTQKVETISDNTAGIFYCDFDDLLCVIPSK